MLASHGVECLLKAFLTRNGETKRATRTHNLSDLWALAMADGLEAESSEPPHWISGLSLIHASPYALRYLGHTDPTTGERAWVHGLSIPPAASITEGYGYLLATIENHLRAGPPEPT
jgi:hypothetical protein